MATTDKPGKGTNVIVQPNPDPRAPTRADQLPGPPAAPRRDYGAPPDARPVPQNAPVRSPASPFEKATPNPARTPPPQISPAAKPTGFEYGGK